MDYTGVITIGELEINCAVLPDGERILSQANFLRSIGRSRSPKAGTGILSTVDKLPFFLQAKSLKPFIDKDLKKSTTPIFYTITKDGKPQAGYKAELLTQVCETYLRLRDASLIKNGKVPKTHAHIVAACDSLMRGLAHIGIVALVDEATGYQDFRERDALQKILAKFLNGEAHCNGERNRRTPSLESQVNMDQGSIGGQLNPEFVEWLMGYPIGHTELKPLETQSCQRLQKS